MSSLNRDVFASSLSFGNVAVMTSAVFRLFYDVVCLHNVFLNTDAISRDEAKPTIE